MKITLIENVQNDYPDRGFFPEEPNRALYVGKGPDGWWRLYVVHDWQTDSVLISRNDRPDWLLESEPEPKPAETPDPFRNQYGEVCDHSFNDILRALAAAKGVATGRDLR